jgi:hypothetical protein
MGAEAGLGYSCAEAAAEADGSTTSADFNIVKSGC